MYLSTHYYVLSLSHRHNKLYECFRDSFNEIQNDTFPVNAPENPGSPSADTEDPRLGELFAAVEREFAHHYQVDPLGLVIVGERPVRIAFESVSAHLESVIGTVEGDHTDTSARDLGQIVWPIVKEAMSGLAETALRELEIAENSQRLVSGLVDIGRCTEIGVGSTLLVEENYHLRGTLKRVDRDVTLSEEIDILEVMDDVVDTVIETVLKIGGKVVFMAAHSLKRQNGIALIPRGVEAP